MGGDQGDFTLIYIILMKNLSSFKRGLSLDNLFGNPSSTSNLAITVILLSTIMNMIKCKYTIFLDD